MPGKFLHRNLEKIWSQIFSKLLGIIEDEGIRKFWKNLHVFRKSAEISEKFWNRIFCGNYNIHNLRINIEA